MNQRRDYAYLLTPIDGSSEESQTFQESLDFAEFPEIIRGIEKDLSNDEDDLEGLSSASTFFNSPVDKLVSPSIEKEFIGYNSFYYAKETEKNQSNESICEKLEFNISLAKDNKLNSIIPFQRGKKIKSRHFMKKNWQVKLKNFKESRIKKYSAKVNSWFNKTNPFSSVLDEKQRQARITSKNDFNQVNKMPNFTNPEHINSIQGKYSHCNDNFPQKIHNFSSSYNTSYACNSKNMTPPLYPSRTLKMNQFLNNNRNDKSRAYSIYEQMPCGFRPAFEHTHQADFVNINNSFVNLEFNKFTPIGSNINYSMHGKLRVRASSFNFV